MSGLVITCPDCQTSYNADADSIGSSGRNVRCARCSVIWFVPPSDIIDQLITDPHALAHAENIAASQSVDPVVQPFDRVPDAAPASTPVEPELPPERDFQFTPEIESSPVNPDPVVTDRVHHNNPQIADAAPEHSQTVGADVVMRDMTDSEKLTRRQRTIRIIWAVPILIVLLAAIAAWFSRQAIMNRIPQMASVYQMLGANVRAGGLEIESPDAALFWSMARPSFA